MNSDREQFAENVMDLLWQTTKDRNLWPQLLVRWCGQASAVRLLMGETAWIKNIETTATAMADATNFEVESLIHTRLIKQTEILQNNIEYLVSGLAHGQIGELAKELGVNQSTITRWRSGMPPSRPNLVALLKYFQLGHHVDLSSDPIFLSYLPQGDMRRRAWLKQHIDQLPTKELNELFPALRKLLGGNYEND